jgi:hypothetical protein
MGLDPIFLSRIQFAFVISFHIIFPAFTIGLAAWLATIEGAQLATGSSIYRRVFDFWLKVFAGSFARAGLTNSQLLLRWLMKRLTGYVEGTSNGSKIAVASIGPSGHEWELQQRWHAPNASKLVRCAKRTALSEQMVGDNATKRPPPAALIVRQKTWLVARFS